VFSKGGSISLEGLGPDEYLQREIPGAKSQPHTTIAKAGHFLQEDKGSELAQLIVDFMAKNPAASDRAA
jgi:haloalkane dehalogenase